MKSACLSLALVATFSTTSALAQLAAKQTVGAKELGNREFGGNTAPGSTATPDQPLPNAATSSAATRAELLWGGDLQGGEPYVFEAEGAPDGIRGFEVDIARALAKQLGRRARFVQTEWSKLVPGLERHDFDIILNGLEDTPERRARLSLSDAYFVYGETLTYRQAAPLADMRALTGRRVGTLSQTVAEALLREHHAEVVLYEGQQEPYLDLAAGRLDAVLLDHPIAQRYGCAMPTLGCSAIDLGRGHYVIGLRRDEADLTRRLNQAIAELRKSGELRGILEEWGLWDARQAGMASKAASIATATPYQSPRWTLAQLRLFLEGALLTLVLSFAAFALASPLGIVTAIARLYGGPGARWLAVAYVELFRGTPLLLQLYVLYFGISDYVRLSPITAAVLGLCLNYGAYEAEVHRGALLSLPRGQLEAARALGLSRWQALRHVLLPQSLKQALPAATNDFVALLKDSSQISVITVVELTKRMTIVAVEVRDWLVPGLLCAGLYFVMGFPLTRLSRRLEYGLSHHVA